MALTKFNYNSFDLTTAASSGLAFNSNANGFETSSAGSMTLIKTLTASSSGTLSFVNGSSDVVLDNTYPVYLFKVFNAHPSDTSNQGGFVFNGSDDTSSHSYDITKTTSFVRAYHFESDSAASLDYTTGNDLAQSTAFQRLTHDDDIGDDADSGCSGKLYLFNPSSTTFVKHFMSRFNGMSSNAFTHDSHMAGYFNTTSAITAIQFKFASGNIDAGTIKLYGIKDS